ncbi:hypothetical protein AAK899_06645 [Erysipelotrichaceae bacterium 51-3]|uniref:hypothetical protein n=1 Tax=Allobaculum sp. JKK-2023 TaxID=3108943 RepID=UPI002B05E7D2|nr:hypothetical protein [Allobaculum sp. JKK-2023]
MKYDFSKPLTDDQLEVVRWVQENGDDVTKASEHFDLDPADIFKWTIQDYELTREPLMKEGTQNMTEELLAQINTLYEHEVNLNKIWEDFQKAQFLN